MINKVAGIRRTGGAVALAGDIAVVIFLNGNYLQLKQQQF
jgi:hypothetical protein